MKNLYILRDGKPAQVKLPEFIAHCEVFLKDKGIDPMGRTESALSILQADISPWTLDDGSISVPPKEAEDFFEAVRSCWLASQQLHKQMSQPETHIEREQAELEHALQNIDTIRDQEEEEQEKLLSAIVGDSFEVLECGALKLRSDAVLTKEGALTIVGALDQQVDQAENVKEKSTLALAHVIGQIEEKFGDGLDVTQILPMTHKTGKYLSQFRMVYRHFPPDRVQELDKHGRLFYAHWVRLCNRGLRKEDQDALAKFAVKRSSTSEPVGTSALQALAKEYARIPEANRAVELARIDQEGLSTAQAVHTFRAVAQAQGEVPDARRRYLYAYADGTSKLSNDYSRELALEATHTWYLIPEPKLVEGPDTFQDVPFEYVKPEIFEDDPVAVKPVYADYRVYQGPKEWEATGFNNGKADHLYLDATNAEDSIQELIEHFGLDADLKDKNGNQFNLRS